MLAEDFSKPPLLNVDRFILQTEQDYSDMGQAAMKDQLSEVLVIGYESPILRDCDRENLGVL